MYRLLSTVFGLMAGVFGIAVLVFANQFNVLARPLVTSVGWTMLAFGSLFALSVAFDRLDARSRRTPATRILPSRGGVWSILFCVFAMSGRMVICGLPLYIATKLPPGDSWGVAAVRLTFVASTFVIGVVTCVMWLGIKAVVAWRRDGATVEGVS